MNRVIIQWLFTKSNVARGNWTSPVLSSCPAGLLAVNQQDIKIEFYKVFYIYHLQKPAN